MGTPSFQSFFSDSDLFSWLLVASPQCFQASVGSHRSAEGEVTFRALLAALEESGEEARALQLLWEADSAGDANQPGVPWWLVGQGFLGGHVSKKAKSSFSIPKFPYLS